MPPFIARGARSPGRADSGGRRRRDLRRGLARIPRLAGEVAQAFNTPLPMVLAWPVDQILFWHNEAALIAEDVRR